MKHSVVRGFGCGMAMRGVSGPVESRGAHGRRGVSAEGWHTGGLPKIVAVIAALHDGNSRGDAWPHMKKRKHLRQQAEQHGTQKQKKTLLPRSLKLCQCGGGLVQSIPLGLARSLMGSNLASVQNSFRTSRSTVQGWTGIGAPCSHGPSGSPR